MSDQQVDQSQDFVMGSGGAVRSTAEFIRQLNYDQGVLLSAVQDMTVRAKPRLFIRPPDAQPSTHAVQCFPVTIDDLEMEQLLHEIAADQQANGAQFVQRVLDALGQQQTEAEPEDRGAAQNVGFWLFDRRVLLSRGVREEQLLFVDPRGAEYALMDYRAWLYGERERPVVRMVDVEPMRCRESELRVVVHYSDPRDELIVILPPDPAKTTVVVRKGDRMDVYHSREGEDPIIFPNVQQLGRHLLDMEERRALLGRMARVVYRTRKRRR
ncbi:hypothetical protein HZA86_01735 [Candidatus Uhrbacteria bacterium]|nr:hypothetical protein [Candidatus Uhrbacteria bacterium]